MIYALIIILMFLSPLFINWKKKEQNFYLDGTPFVFGHRGTPALEPENTLPSFIKAIKQGVGGIEFDVRLSGDNNIVIFHDKNLIRLFGVAKKIENMDYQEIQKHVNKQNINIPLLADIVPLINKTKAINIEIKSDGLFHGHKILDPLIAFLDAQKIYHKCIVSSFNPTILLSLKRKRPQTIIGFLYNKNSFLHRWNNIIWMIRVQPDNLHIHYSLIDIWPVCWARKKGIKINSYTINDKTVYDDVKTKIHGVFTDNIEYIK